MPPGQVCLALRHSLMLTETGTGDLGACYLTPRRLEAILLPTRAGGSEICLQQE
jgi:hypothetical protein